MEYKHEQQERKENVHPMCNTLPVMSVNQFNMNDYLEERHLDWMLARENGWYESVEAGDSRPRVVMPAVTHVKDHVYWQARDIYGKAYLRYTSPKGPRHEALILVEPHHHPKGVVIVEGPMDALAAAGAGYVGIALMGMTPSQATLYHLTLLVHDYFPTNVLVLLDRGEVANATKVMLFLASQGFSAKIAELDTKDLAASMPLHRRKFLADSFARLFSAK